MFVRTVDRVSRLEGNDRLPAFLLEEFAGLLRVEAMVGGRGICSAGEEMNLPADQAPRPGIDAGDPRVVAVDRPVDRLCFGLCFTGEDFLYLHHPVDDPVLSAKCRPSTTDERFGKVCFDRENDRNRPYCLCGEAHLPDHARIRRGGHEPGERAVETAGDVVEFGEGGVGERDCREITRSLFPVGFFTPL